MRIIGHIDHPVIKITVFKMDDKFSVKFETGLYEQTYKFRGSDAITGIEDIKALVDEGFINNVLAEMTTLHRIKSDALARFLPEEEDDFDEII